MFRVQNQNPSNALYDGPPHSFTTLMHWEKWLTQPCVDCTLPSHSPDLLILLPSVFSWSPNFGHPCRRWCSH
ncbi:hypothetical protein I3843_01G085900 [Carya illinoinensis]|nr:hypothetical protein I3843_01G085900 [Carya illinoinensis]